MDDRYHRDWPLMSRWVREHFGNRCARCHQSGEKAEVTLQVHHIDENPGNNELENLIPLCSRCHLQIEKEARRHAPYQAIQAELFADSSYQQALAVLRQEALQQNQHEPEANLDVFEQEEWEWEQENH